MIDVCDCIGIMRVTASVVRRSRFVLCINCARGFRERIFFLPDVIIYLYVEVSANVS